MGTTRIDALPKEIRQEELYPRSPLSALGLLAQTSKQYEAETSFLRLLAASINAAPEFLDDEKDETALASIAILKKHPELLFRKKKVTDHYGREIWASPYQIFLGAGDIWALKQVYEEIIQKIENGEAQAKVQCNEQFPNYEKKLDDGIDEEARFYDDRNNQQIEEIVKQLAAVKQLIDVDPFTNNKPLDATKLAVETLCKLFQPKPEEVIQSGLHFPLGIIKEVYKIYNALQGHWSFFSLAVIKPALDALSTVDGQCCQYSLKDLDMEKGPNRRCHSSYRYPLGQPLSLTLVNDKHKRGAALVDPYDGEVLFASTTSDYFDCFNKKGSRRRQACVGVGSAGLGVARAFGKLMENKSRSLWELLCSHAQRTQHTVTMSITTRGNV